MAFPSPLTAALIVEHSDHASIAALETALAVLDRDGDPANLEHVRAVFALHRRLGRVYGHRPLPAKWERT